MYKSSYTGSQIDEAVAKANEAAPQSTTYTKPEVDSALSGKQATLVVDTNLDSAPTENSTNPVTSGGVYTALSGKANTSDIGAAAAKGFDTAPTSGNTNNAVSSDGVYQALATIKDGANIDSFGDVETALAKKIDHDIPALTSSILDYANALPVGIYFARHNSGDGPDKPETGKRYMYQIMKYTTETMTLIAYEGQAGNSNSIYMKHRTSGTWGSWIKFTGTVVT